MANKHFVKCFYLGTATFFLLATSSQASPYCYPQHFKKGLAYIPARDTPFFNYGLVSDIYNTNPIVEGKLSQVEDQGNFFEISAQLSQGANTYDCKVISGSGRYRSGFDSDISSFKCGNILLKKNPSSGGSGLSGFHGGIEFSRALIGNDQYYVINAIRPFSPGLRKLPEGYKPPSTDKLFPVNTKTRCINYVPAGTDHDNMTYAYGPRNRTPPPYGCVQKSICEVNGTSTLISERLLLVPSRYKENLERIYYAFEEASPGAVEQQYPTIKSQLESFFARTDIIPIELFVKIFAPVK